MQTQLTKYTGKVFYGVQAILLVQLTAHHCQYSSNILSSKKDPFRYNQEHPYIPHLKEGALRTFWVIGLF